MRAFTHEQRPVRVLFGNDTLVHVKEEVVRLRARHAFVISTPNQVALAERVAELLRDVTDGVRVYSNATMHTPVSVTEDAITQLGQSDCLVAIGGGSTTGLAKAIALRRRGMPQIIIPTTYAGSEATAVVGQTQDGKKTTTKDWAILPGTIIYDVSLTLTLRPTMTCTSGLNAVAHAVEALYANNATPITDMFAVRGIRSMLSALMALHAQPSSIDARSDALEASWLCGTVLSQAQMGVHHKLCHAMGGQLNTPHAETHAILLPYSLLYNFATLTARQRALFEDAFGTQDGMQIAKQIQQILVHQTACPKSLAELNVEKGNLADVAKEVANSPYPNPRALQEAPLLALLEAAWAGVLRQ